MRSTFLTGLGVVFLLPGAVLLTSCSPSTELEGAVVPNALPNTFITAETPAPLESSFVMTFHWDAYDPDGAIRGFQWKMSDNGPDGISIGDTLTSDPATGSLLHPWHFTTNTDTTLIVSADINGFPPDNALDPYYQRAYQYHTMFVRAVDREGGIDPTPALVSFTATTILPRIRIDRPARLANYLDAQAGPPSLVFGYTGSDPDFDLGNPAKIRYLLKPAWLNDHYVRTKYEFDSVVDQLVSFSDSAWSGWVPYADDPANRVVRFDRLPSQDVDGRQIIYLFAIQAEDTAGAVSLDRTYARTVHNVFISEGFTPVLSVREQSLGRHQATGVNSRTRTDIPQGRSVQFEWVASADDYNGLITAYRYGWDLADPNDESDQHWAIQPGISSQHRHSIPISFGSGTHTLTVQAWDNAGQLSRFTWILEIAPVPDPDQRRPLLLVDNVSDQSSNTWSGIGGRALDNDVYRDAFWSEVLAGAGGVANFSPTGDVVDLESRSLTYRDLIDYNVILWTTRYVIENFIWDTFKPNPEGEQPYNWLQAYQENVGDVFLAGSRALNEFVEHKNWMMPWVFDSLEETMQIGNWWVISYYIGFGNDTLEDGSTVLRGTQRYPYSAMGVSVLDHTSPKYRIYGVEGADGIGTGARDPRCVGLKALVLDPAFKSAHMPEGDVIPDTIFTEAAIDWQDLDPDYRDHLQTWRWGDDEFYDANITSRPNYWRVQQCGDRPCLEPMFRAYTRFDWVDDLHQAAGDPDWPLSVLGSWSQVLRQCGTYGVDFAEGRTAITGKTVGFYSHKLEGSQPQNKADVVWGFDPYRFDHAHISPAIQWVLGEHFGLRMNP